MDTSVDGIVRCVSPMGVEQVLTLLLSILESKAITIFAVVDHSGEASRVGFAMPETKLVIFGNPRAGTPVMLAAPGSALDLPLKILLSALPDGATQLSYNSPDYLRARHGIPLELLPNIAAIEPIVAAVVNATPYA